MAGRVFLCVEGYHKVRGLIRPGEHLHAEAMASATRTAQAIEDERIRSAIQTDFIFSAEIMAITIASVSTSPLWLQGGVLAVVGIGMTLLVYGVMAAIVKANDAGWPALAQTNASSAGWVVTSSKACRLFEGPQFYRHDRYPLGRRENSGPLSA